MNKKELRKELELSLVRSIEAVLSKNNSAATKKIRKTTFDASKTIAKKFYKSLKATVKVAPEKEGKKSVRSALPVSTKALKPTIKPVASRKAKPAIKASSAKNKN